MNPCDWFRRAVDVRRVNVERAELQSAYDNAIAKLRRALEACSTLEQREAALQAALAAARERVADLGFQCECLMVDNADLERVNEALRGGLQFFDPSSGRSEA